MGKALQKLLVHEDKDRQTAINWVKLASHLTHNGHLEHLTATQTGEFVKPVVSHTGSKVLFWKKLQ